MENKIYDTFNFFNELELLDLRLNTLDEYVDYFVLVESNVTHTGVSKPYYYELNKELFSKFKDKIIHLKIEDIPNNFNNLKLIENPKNNDEIYVNEIINFINNQQPRKLFDINHELEYGRDFYQKECVRRGLYNCNSDDIIIFSDCDEIPNPNILKEINKLNLDDNFYSLNQKTYYYYLNVLKSNEWEGSKIGKYKNLKNFSYNQLRAKKCELINNGGWHFSFMGGNDRVKLKIQSYSAQDMNSEKIINSIDDNIINNIDPFFRGSLTNVEIDETYPKYLLENIEKYKKLIKL